MIMTILLVPLMIFSVVYIALTIGALITQKDYRPDMNMTPETSWAMIVITFGLTIVMITAFIGSVFHLPPDHGLAAYIAQLMFYMSIAGAWFWLYECYKQRVYLKFIKR